MRSPGSRTRRARFSRSGSGSGSRLGCQARVAGEDVVVEITEESLRAWLDENPEERKKEAATRA